MNNFNNVFAAVQRECSIKGSVIGSDQFQKIAAEVGVSLERLHFYLDCLEQTGVIKYSPEKKSITMTDKGVKAERVFP